MGLFDKIGNVKAKVQANYISPGHYVCRIDKVLAKQNRKQEDTFIIEMTVIHVFDDNDGKGHKIGEEISNVINFRHDMALPNIKRFLCAVLDRPESDITSQVCERVCSDKQPLAGLIVEIQAKPTVTKAGNDFTDVGYRRTVPASLLVEILDEEAITRFFPDGKLEAMLQKEQSKG